jgi:hypothetical protein
MQAGSFGLVATVIGIGALAIALGITFAAPLLAVPFFIIGFGVFLVLRARRRTRERGDGAYRSQVPTTEETAADPVADSSAPDAARVRSNAQSGHEVRRAGR